MVNEHGICVRIYVNDDNDIGLAIMNDNDVLQTKYVAYMLYGMALSSFSIGDTVHIVIDDVKQNMGTSDDDAFMITESTTITINNGSNSNLRGTWTSTIVPENVTVELDCVVVEVNKGTGVITAKCGHDQWPKSVFNRIPIYINGDARFGSDSVINHAMFGKNGFDSEGYVPNGWNQYKVTESGSSLIIGDGYDKVTIMGLPESFVSHWIDTIHVKAYMGDYTAMLVPPE